MDVNQIYRSITDFWASISPLIYAHVLFLIGIVYLGGLRFDAVEHIQQWMRTERYLKWKQVLKEFGLWKRLPLIVLAFSLIYLTLLQDGLTLIGSLPIPLFRIVYSEEQLWIEAKPLDEIGRIAKFAPLESQQLWD